jgi:hypothetical protein
MSIVMLSKNLAGISNILGGTLVAIAYVFHPHHQTPDVIATNVWLLVHVLFALSLIFGIFGLIGIFLQHIQRSTLNGLVGFLLAVFSLVSISGLNFFEAFINPVLAIESTDFVHQYGAGTEIGLVALLFPFFGACFLVGYSLLCVDIMRAKSLNTACAGLTLLGTVVFGLGLSGFLPMLIVQTGAVLFGVGLICMGLAIMQRNKGSSLKALT